MKINTIGRLVVPSMLAMALAAGLSVSASASPDDRYGSSSSYMTNGRQVTTNFTSGSSGGGNDRMNAQSGYRDHDDRDDDHDNDHDGYGSPSGGGYGDSMGDDHDGGGHDGGDDD